MGASVVERADLIVRIAQDDEGTQPHATRDEVVAVRDLALVCQICPCPAEDMRHLGFEDGGIGVDQPMRAVFLDQVIPVIKRGPAEPAGRRSDLLQRRHDVLPSTCSCPACSGPGGKAQKKSKYSFCSQALASSLWGD